jgi:hypothetical protein
MGPMFERRMSITTDRVPVFLRRVGLRAGQIKKPPTPADFPCVSLELLSRLLSIAFLKMRSKKTN